MSYTIVCVHWSVEPSLTHTHLKEATGSRAPSAGSQRNNCCLFSLGGIFNFLFLFLCPVFLDSANISTFVFCSAVLQFNISMLTNVKQPVVLFTVVVIVFGKYVYSSFSSICWRLGLFSILPEQNHDDADVFFYLLIVFSTVSSLYTLIWDLKMDWGLFDRNAGENTFLREEIVYPQKVRDFLLSVTCWDIETVRLGERLDSRGKDNQRALEHCLIGRNYGGFHQAG